ncbi:hypothetical protein TNCV_2140881 [Trichonephila clavipes]|uniref:Uncharacterized protein n=1 Tax=Trichonephila clavipes TaxID=2585209 RepID=A0A8X6VC36_TRICX|nr:hypothetical protein TNCV_2140881 [Trichonephila clavipes]
MASSLDLYESDTKQEYLLETDKYNGDSDMDLYICDAEDEEMEQKTATAGSDVVQSGRPIFDNFFQHLWPYIGNNTANVVFQMVKRLWLIRIDQ